MMNPIAIQEVTRATQFERDQQANTHALLNQASRDAAPKPDFVARVRRLVGTAFIRAGVRISQTHQFTAAPDGEVY
jgi:hypothetical protein